MPLPARAIHYSADVGKEFAKKYVWPDFVSELEPNVWTLLLVPKSICL